MRALRISALACHGYKWLLADFGVGAVYVAPSALEYIRPIFVGEQSIAEPPSGGEKAMHYPFDWQPGARRYSAGGSNTLGLVALGTSLGLIEQIGMPVIHAHNRGLAELLVRELGRVAGMQLVSPADPARRSAIIVFTLGDSARDAALVQRLAEQGICVAHRRRGIRVSPHWYNTAEEIERFAAAAAQLA